MRVLEREDVIGGAIQTAELTEPGYLHDVFSAWHPLWVGGAALAELGDVSGPSSFLSEAEQGVRAAVGPDRWT